ncbi:MAG TPA: Na+/H+ antiporter [Thermoleophilaceae bacterium]|nr:Na+/H+ antiporter [Thermoleophilaceae bacterium]
MSSGATQVAEVIVLLVVVGVALTSFARRFGLPEPVLLVAGGVALSFVPGMPSIPLEPELVLLIFVGPLLYVDGYFAPVRELRRNAVSIGLLASVLVVVTAAGVAVVAHYTIDMAWPVAFALGAALSATDALAPVQVLESESAEPRLLAVIRGESLLNDGVAFALVGVAGTAAAAEKFSPAGGLLELVVYIVGGVGAGLLVAVLVGKLRSRSTSTRVEAGMSLITPFAAFIVAELVHGSGIMAAVAAGLWVGHHSHGFVDPLVRIEIQSAWRVVGFVLNSLLFLLVGLQTRDIIDTVDQPMGRVLLAGAAVTVAVIGLRLLWALTIAPVWRGTVSKRRPSVRPPSSRPWRLVLGWSGVRGSVALAAALAIPATLDSGGPLPGRELAIVLTLFVIVATLLIQGLTLRPLVRRMGLTDPDAIEQEKRLALQTASEVALKALPEAAERHGLKEDERWWLEREYELRNLRAVDDDDDGDAAQEVLEAAAETDAELLTVARKAILELEGEGEVRSDVAQEVIRRLDLSSARLRH